MLLALLSTMVSMTSFPLPFCQFAQTLPQFFRRTHLSGSLP